jgi:ankyrin repeat protein
MIKSDFPHAHITALRKLIISRDLDWLGTSNTLNPSVSELYSTALTFANSGNSAAYLQSLSQKFLRYNKVVYRGLVLMCFQKNSLKILRHFPGFPVSEIGGDAHGNTPMHWIVHHMSNSQYVEDTELLSWFDEFARFDSCVLAKNNAGHTPLDVAFLSSSGCYIQVVLPHFEKLRPAIATEVLKSAISYDAGVLESLVSEKQPTKPIFRHHSTTIGRERIRINPNIAMNGMTPLEFALKNSFCDSAIVLLQSGADSNALSSDYKSPLQLLCEYHALSPYFTNVLSVLRSSGAKMRRPVQDGCSTCLTVRLLCDDNYYSSS